MCNADDAAALIQVFRDEPLLLKTTFGMEVNAAAIKKIKGTPWEAVLFPKPTSITDARMIKRFHEALDKSEAEREQAELKRIDEQRRKSAGYIAEVRELKRRQGPEGEGIA